MTTKTPEQLGEEYERQPKSTPQLIAETEREKRAYRNGYEAGAARWVPCSERLPENNNLTIVKVGQGFFLANYSDGKFWEHGMPGSFHNTTHWLDNVPPTPGNPKDEETK